MRTELHCLPCVLLWALSLAVVVGLAGQSASDAGEPLRAGIIGCDTSHVIAFAKVLNNPKAEGPLAQVKITAAFPGGSPDLAPSRDRVDKFTQQLRGMDVKIVDSIPELLEQVDVVLLESVDGRPHLEQARPVFAAHKPVFVDKPVAASLADAIEIFELAKEYDTPCFSSSSLRFGEQIQSIHQNKKLGRIDGCMVYGPCAYQSFHPDLYWYGIHGVEMLYTVMGAGCERVSRVHTEDTDVVVGVWKDGRVGTYRGNRKSTHDFGAVVFGTKAIVTVGRDNYDPMMQEVAKFFLSGRPPVDAETTLEIYTFLDAADESKRLGGATVSLKEIRAKAQAEVDARRRAGP